MAAGVVRERTERLIVAEKGKGGEAIPDGERGA
jgi:hypothetical protein